MNPTPDSYSSRDDNWSRYWAGGALHSCLGSFSGNYSGDVEDFWRQCAEGVGGSGRILDIGTGNGAIPKLLLEASGAGPCPQMDGIDLARVQPAWYQSLPPADRARICFHSGVRAELLPFPSQAFDRVVSQFGVEYTQLAASLDEAARVLKADGACAFVIHHRDSIIVSQARVEIEHLEWLAGQQVLSLAKDVCGHAAAAAQAARSGRTYSSAEGDAARNQLNGLLSQCQSRAAASACPDVLDDSLRLILRAAEVSYRSGQSQPAQAELQRMEATFADAIVRLQELVSCAMGRDQLLDVFEHSPLMLDSCKELCFPDGQILGWAVTAKLCRDGS